MCIYILCLYANVYHISRCTILDCNQQIRWYLAVPGLLWVQTVAAGVGDGPATAAQLMYVICFLYCVWFLHCFWDIMWVCVLSRLKWVVAFEADMGWEKVKVG